jgi:hypothetical protein
MSTIEQIRRMLERAKADYQGAAAMHSMGKVSFYGGRVEALEDVLKLLTGSVQ